MGNKFWNWFLFVMLSFIWGSSFVLMKEGLVKLTAFQVASLRIVLSGLILLPMAIQSFRKIPSNKIILVFLSGTLGSLLPAYLFCIAEQQIDSAVAGALNSLTPIFVIVTGALFFHSKTSTNKIIGILVAFSGSILMFLSQPNPSLGNNWGYLSFVIIATFFYGLNVNLVHRYLNGIPSLQIVSMALTLNAIPAFVVLYFSGYFGLDFNDKEVLMSSGSAAILGIVGTSVANILFYILIKRAGAIFSSMVTYGIPFVAIFWGFFYDEKVGFEQIMSLFIILFGVYIANRMNKTADRA
jgi:drug/metabolite transporter (DMT)-like permease